MEKEGTMQGAEDLIYFRLSNFPVILLPSEVHRICVAREVIYNTNPEMTASYTRLRLFQPLLQSPRQLAGVQDPKIAY